MLEIDHLDPDFGLMLAEKLLRGIGVVEILALAVLARTGMVAPDDHVGAAVVAADDAVPDRLTRATHAHRQVQKRQRGGLGRILVQDRLIAADAGEVVDVARLGHADDGVDQQVRLGLTRGAEGQFLVRAVQWVPGLEGHDLAPAQLAEQRAQFVRRVAAGLEVIMHRLLDAGDRATQIDLACRVVQVVHRRMGQIVGPKDLGRLIRLVGAPLVADRQDRQDHAFLIAQGDVLTGGDLFGKGFVHVQRDRHRPQRAIGQAHVLHHAVIIRLPHEPLQRVESAVHQKLQVADLPRGQVPRGQIPRLDLQFLGGLIGNIKLGDRGVVRHGHGINLSAQDAACIRAAP